MKRFFLPLILGLLCTANLAVGRDDAAVAAAAARQEAEENYRALKGKVEDILEARDVQNKRLNDRLQQLTREIAELRDLAARPKPVYATPEDIKKLAEAIQEVDRKRVEDSERHSNELKEVLAKLLAASAPPPKPAPPVENKPEPVVDPGPTAQPTDNETGFEYVVKKGDYLSTIAKAYREKGVKVTVEQIEKANPGVKSDKLYVGKKLWIPAPATISAGTK